MVFQKKKQRQRIEISKRNKSKTKSIHHQCWERRKKKFNRFLFTFSCVFPSPSLPTSSVWRIKYGPCKIFFFSKKFNSKQNEKKSIFVEIFGKIFKFQIRIQFSRKHRQRIKKRTVNSTRIELNSNQTI